jgi:hypothetical protein
MKTFKVVIEISEERLLACLKLAGEDLGLELSEDLDMDKLKLEFSEDLENHIDQDLPNFIEEGLNQDLYQDYFNWKDEEDEDED